METRRQNYDGIGPKSKQGQEGLKSYLKYLYMIK
jgi:hypothetical protein